MKVTLKKNYANGTLNIFGYPNDVIELPEEEGQRLIDQGDATLADPNAEPRPQ